MISRRNSPRSGLAGGFTFIEVLATLTLLAIVLPSIMSGFSLCMATADAARQQSEASSLCHDKLMEIVAQKDWQHATLTGDFGEDWPGYTWTSQVVDYETTTLKSVDMTVSWRHGAKDRNVTMTTLVYTGTQ